MSRLHTSTLGLYGIFASTALKEGENHSVVAWGCTWRECLMMEGHSSIFGGGVVVCEIGLYLVLGNFFSVQGQIANILGPCMVFVIYSSFCLLVCFIFTTYNI